MKLTNVEIELLMDFEPFRRQVEVVCERLSEWLEESKRIAALSDKGEAA